VKHLAKEIVHNSKIKQKLSLEDYKMIFTGMAKSHSFDGDVFESISDEILKEI
jgi:Sec7-like guanine-nucleotide exchange factor